MAVCGDGSMEGPEKCDDGNTADGDGCSSACLVSLHAVLRCAALRCAVLCSCHLRMRALLCVTCSDTITCSRVQV